MAFEKATFAGGCFWCMVKPFDTLPGIESVISGYTGGHVENPTYEQVCTGTTGHTEAVQITFDPEVFPYKDLVEVYWQQTDPTDPNGQFVDQGNSYRPAIFYHSDEQKEILDLFSNEKYNFFKALKKAFYPKRIRRTLMDDLMLRIIFVLGVL